MLARQLYDEDELPLPGTVWRVALLSYFTMIVFSRNYFILSIFYILFYILIMDMMRSSILHPKAGENKVKCENN
jgi:uncharacterized membrane protein